MTSDTAQRSAATRARLLAGMLAGVGVTHFVYPKPFDALIPAELPGNPRIYTHGSGLAEVVTAGLLVAPRTRRLGGLVAALLFLAVFPGNLNAVRLYWGKPQLRAVMIARLPLQIPMVVTALRVWRTA